MLHTLYINVARERESSLKEFRILLFVEETLILIAPRHCGSSASELACFLVQTPEALSLTEPPKTLEAGFPLIFHDHLTALTGVKNHNVKEKKDSPADTRLIFFVDS